MQSAAWAWRTAPHPMPASPRVGWVEQLRHRWWRSCQSSLVPCAACRACLLAHHTQGTNASPHCTTHPHLLPPTLSPAAPARRAAGICPVRQLRDEGVNVGLGVDGCASNDSGNLLEQARWALLLQRGLLREGPTLLLPAPHASMSPAPQAAGTAACPWVTGQHSCLSSGSGARLALCPAPVWRALAQATSRA